MPPRPQRSTCPTLGATSLTYCPGSPVSRPTPQLFFSLLAALRLWPLETLSFPDPCAHALQPSGQMPLLRQMGGSCHFLLLCSWPVPGGPMTGSLLVILPYSQCLPGLPPSSCLQPVHRAWKLATPHPAPSDLSSSCRTLVCTGRWSHSGS